ncbi:MAG: hypothetical protein ACFCUR_07390 [Rhodomicrobiaceae bacterium]
MQAAKLADVVVSAAESAKALFSQSEKQQLIAVADALRGAGNKTSDRVIPKVANSGVLTRPALVLKLVRDGISAAFPKKDAGSRVKDLDLLIAALCSDEAGNLPTRISEKASASTGRQSMGRNSARPLNETAIAGYLKKLQGSLGDPQQGLTVVEELRRDRTAVTKAEVFEIARRFTGATVRKSDTRAKLEGLIRSMFTGQARRDSKGEAMQKTGTV